jgi:flagellar basal-body rod protein FlgG
MIDALYISASGLRGEQKQIDVISNNVANMQTPGFKRSRVNFVDVASMTATSELQVAVPGYGGGTRVVSTALSFDAGELRATQRPLDLAIDGAGFFELEAEDGHMVYSRDGRFRLDAEGYLMSVSGLRLAGSVQIPTDASNVRISASGEVSASLAGDTERTVLGQIELTAFAAPDALVATGNSDFTATDAAGATSYGKPGEIGLGSLRQGYVEMANVDMIEEMSTLVMAQRAYQLNARVLQASDQILDTINNLRR